MLANADLNFDEDEDEDDYDYNHLNSGKNDAFNDYKLSSKNSFGNNSDLVAFGRNTGNSVIAASGPKITRQIRKDEEDQFLDDIINRNPNQGKSSKAPPAVNFWG